MPDLVGTLQTLVDLPLYKYEKPYTVLLPSGMKTDGLKLHNLAYEDHDGVLFTDIRGKEAEFNLESCGFEIIPYGTSYTRLETTEEINQYKKETADFLKERFQALHVICYEARVLSPPISIFFGKCSSLIVQEKRGYGY
jgi:hypothetical protein